MKLIIDGVRCFHQRQAALLRPLTLLIGENSAGKSTLLAFARIAWSATHGYRRIDFNEEPFLLGSFDQVASASPSGTTQARRFTTGYEVTLPRAATQRFPHVDATASITCTFVRSDGLPRLSLWDFQCAPYRVTLDYAGDELAPPQTRIVGPSGTVTLDSRASNALLIRPPDLFSYLRYILDSDPQKIPGSIEGTVPSAEDLGAMEGISEAFFSALGPKPYAFAPIRTRPVRTYDPLRDAPNPEGTHIPIVLARSFSGTKREQGILEKTVREFGESAGLFTSLHVRRMGRKESDPFQIQVRVAGPRVNLTDVGYGVNQVLPIVVDILRHHRRQAFLLQQPEVHLHPKAQAAFASFLAALAKRDQKQFIIETHSDFIVDRLRIEAGRQTLIRNTDISLLHLTRGRGGHVAVHQLEIDEGGNIVGAPPSYRAFFLEEERALLGLH